MRSMGTKALTVKLFMTEEYTVKNVNSKKIYQNVGEVLEVEQEQRILESNGHADEQGSLTLLSDLDR